MPQTFTVLAPGQPLHPRRFCDYQKGSYLQIAQRHCSREGTHRDPQDSERCALAAWCHSESPQALKDCILPGAEAAAATPGQGGRGEARHFNVLQGQISPLLPWAAVKLRHKQTVLPTAACLRSSMERSSTPASNPRWQA